MRFVFGECQLDVERFELRQASHVITIEPKAFRVLAYLLKHCGRAVSKRDLLQTFWPGTSDAFYLEYSLRNCLYKIRQAIGNAGTQGAVIETIRGHGYRVVTPVSVWPTNAVLDPIAIKTTVEADAPATFGPSTPSIVHPGRRQLTLLRCELVQQPAWAHMDPEDFQALVHSFAGACTEVMQRFDGHIAQHEGDACWVYFGYPTADEEAPQRAVWTALALVEAVQHLVVPLLEPLYVNRPEVRVGIHTGHVVEGDGQNVSLTPAISGPVFALAKRALAEAPPGSVVITTETHHLVQGYFTCQPLNEHLSTEDQRHVTLYRVLGLSGLHTRFEVAATHGLTPFVGREPELAWLRHGWGQTQTGNGHMLLLSGEPGIGKSRLVQMIKDDVATQPHLRWECRSSPYYQHTPLFPLIAFFHQAMQWQPDDTQAQKLTKWQQVLRQYHLPIDESVSLFASWLSVSLPETPDTPLQLSAQQQRQQMLEHIVAMLLQLVERQPVLLILEDVHWADPTTLELLELILDQLPTAAIFAVLTCRPTFQPHWSPRSCLTQLTLNRLSQDESEAMLSQMVCGKALPPEVMAHVVNKTDGVPLFVEALLTMILDTGLLQEEAERYVLTGHLPLSAIPATLQDLLMARLDRLLEARDVVQLAAVLGREFSYELLLAVASLDAPTLQERLARAKDLELIYQRGIPPQARYRFKHALIQEAAYHALLKRTRQQMHERVAQVMEAQFPQMVATQPEILAHHHAAAGHAAQAIPYWYQAAQQAIERSAYVEARTHLNQALDHLIALPETPEQAQQELSLRITLGRVMMATQGQAAPEVEQVYSRALDLCRQIDTTPQLFPALAGLCGYYVMRGGLQTARELGVQLLSLAQNLAHPFSHMFALNYAAWLAYLYRDTQGARYYAETSIQLATELGVPDFLAAATMARGWSLVNQYHSEAGLEQLRQGVVAYRATGAELHITSILVLLAQACGYLGHTDEGLAALDEAEDLGKTYGEYYYAAELYRVKGKLLLTVPKNAGQEATACFQQALRIARQQQTRSWELRAATSLARLWQHHNRYQDAYELLAPVYDAFTEDYETADLRDTRLLLHELSVP